MKSKSVQKLKNLLEGNKELKSLVEKSIAKAKEINPDKITNPAQTLEEYYNFLEASLTRMPWKIFDENFFSKYENTDLAFKTDQCILYPYWILDIPLKELEGNNKFYNSVEHLDEISSWLTDYCNEWKEFLDSPQSWTEETKQIINNEKF